MSNIFNDITDGLLNLDGELIEEAVSAEDLQDNKTILRQVLIPQGMPIGKGNLCFLYTHSQEESIELILHRKNLLDKTNKYKYYYYNLYYQGKIYNKRYRFYDLEKRKELYANITGNKELHLMVRKTLKANESDNKNMYYEIFKYLEIFESICSKLQPIIYIQYYWQFMKQVLSTNIPGYSYRFAIVDIRKYSLSKSVKDNLKNPLFLIYYTFLRKPELIQDFNFDFYFLNDKRILKVNPSKCDVKTAKIFLKTEMKKIMSGINKESEVDDVTNDETLQEEELVSDTVNKVVGKVRLVNSDDTIITTNEQLQKAAKVSAVEKKVETKAKEEIKNIPKEVKDDLVKSPVKADELTNELNNNIRKELEEDQEIIQKIYQSNKSNEIAQKSAISSARDELLRSEQKNIKVNNMTIADLEKVNVAKIPIPVTDVSRNLKTTNENVKQIKFDNFDKAYIEKVMPKDITDSFTALNNKSIPMFVRDIKIEDSSDELNYKDTYTVLLEDGNRKRHTIKVDIPKFVDDKFLYIGGNKKLIKHQNYLYPVVKISPNMVQIVTNYSKMSIERNENKSTSSVERLKKLISSNDDVQQFFTMGSTFVSNKNALTTLEFDDLSKSFAKFKKNNTTIIFFDRAEALEYLNKKMKEDATKFKPEGNRKIFIGIENSNPIYIDINTQVDNTKSSIVDIIVRNLPEEAKEKFKSIKSPKRLMFTKVRIMEQNVTCGMLLGLWEGLSELLRKLKCEYEIKDKVTELEANEDFIKFSDCVLVYKADVPTSLILNGIRMFNTQNYRLVDFDEKLPYIDYIKSVYGRVIIENALMNFYEFVIDPITKEVLETLNLPTDIVSLFIYAVNLLADSQFENEISQNLYRVRCAEIIPAILYERISKNYVAFRNYGGRKKFSIPQDCVIKEILSQKTVEDYSTLNPAREMEMLHAISAKGFRGINLDDSYKMEKRGYDPSMIGIISPSTSPDGNCGVSKTLTLEPKIVNLRGFTEDYFQEGKLDDLKDVNLFSPGEMSMPLTATTDDPTRLGHALSFRAII